jgi:hypothetical protein
VRRFICSWKYTYGGQAFCSIVSGLELQALFAVRKCSRNSMSIFQIGELERGMLMWAVRDS